MFRTDGTTSRFVYAPSRFTWSGLCQLLLTLSSRHSTLTSVPHLDRDFPNPALRKLLCFRRNRLPQRAANSLLVKNPTGMRPNQLHQLETSTSRTSRLRRIHLRYNAPDSFGQCTDPLQLHALGVTWLHKMASPSARTKWSSTSPTRFFNRISTILLKLRTAFSAFFTHNPPIQLSTKRN